MSPRDPIAQRFRIAPHGQRRKARREYVQARAEQLRAELERDIDEHARRYAEGA